MFAYACRVTSGAMHDQFGRSATDLRVSLTDRCNLRCTYCMPVDGPGWLPKSSLLMLVAAFAGLEHVRQAYREAVAARYRFYSYGDAMVIL